MLLVVGLGNPGQEYERTRHNVGFEVVERLASRGAFAAWRQSGNAATSRGVMGSTDVLLVKPLTFMNRSGDAVGSLLRFYKEDVGRLIVVHDDLDFAPGAVRIKMGGGHGGHNGLRSITAHVGAEFVRVRLGIGKPSSRQAGADHVLSTFSKAERLGIDEAIVDAVAAVEIIADKGVLAAMNQFNRRQDETDVDEE